MLFDDAKRFINKKIKGIELINTHYPQDYEPINLEYKRLRNELDRFAGVLDKLSCYEFGGSVMKNVTKISKKLASTSNLLSSEDIYTEAALVGEELANTTHSSSIKAVGNKFSESYQKVAEAKRQMNASLKEISGSLKVLKEDAKAIDVLRRRAEDLRYELEEKIQANVTPKNELEIISNNFNSKSLEALRGMKTFMGDAGVAGLLKKTAQVHKDFNDLSAKALGGF
jgi:DNA repair ATPase RecN